MTKALKTLPFALVVAAGFAGCEKGTNTADNTSYKHPSDAVRQADGTYRYADGSVRNADGSIRSSAPSMPEARDNRNLPNEKPTKPDAVDQSNKQADLDVTQAIRKAVLARDGMSMGAKNVVIVTELGTVTLKGEVASETEKTTIGEIATANAAGRTVDNQLTVKPAQ